MTMLHGSFFNVILLFAASVILHSEDQLNAHASYG